MSRHAFRSGAASSEAHRRPSTAANRRLGRLQRVVILIGVLLIAVGSASAGSPPDFKLKDIKGKQFKLQEHLGKDVMYITFWATWCVPCRREMPELQKLSNDFSDDGFLVVTINTDPASAKSKIKPFMKRHKIDLLTLLDPDNNVHDKFNPTRELPYAVLVNRDGEVFKTYAGYRTGDEEILREEVVELLGSQEGTDGHE